MLRAYRPFLLIGLFLVGLIGCSSNRPPAKALAPAPVPPKPSAPAQARTPHPAAAAPVRPVGAYPVMLGIDVLASDNFAAIRGKRIGLLTHPAGVNRIGRSTIDILHKAPGVKLVALFAPEHALSGQVKAS